MVVSKVLAVQSGRLEFCFPVPHREDGCVTITPVLGRQR